MKKELNAKRRLGRTDFQVTVIGLGGHTYPVGNTSDSFCTYEERAKLIQYLIDSGVNYFDTTWIDEVELLANSFRRANINDDTLVSLQYVDGISDANWRHKLRKELETRLNIMNYTNAPLFLMGIGNANVPYSEIISACEAMAKLKEENLIKNIGISCHQIGLYQLISKAIRETDLIDYMMIRFNWKYQMDVEFDIDDFAGFKNRLWDEREIRNISQYAESETIRQHARNLIKA